MTLAAILLFGSDQLICSVLPQHKTDALMRVYNIDRYDDRDMIETNLLDSYDRLMDFGKKHLNDRFILDGDTRISARNRILREVVGNLLCHRDFSSGYTASMIIEKDKLVTKNGNVSHVFGFLKLDSFKPFAKNPVIVDFFRNIGWADELGSGMRNTYMFTKMYSGGEPSFVEGDMFVCTIPLSEAATVVKMGPEMKEESDVDKLIRYCMEPRSRKEMMEFMGIASRVRFSKNYITPLLESGRLEMTIPDKPTSPSQKYKASLDQ